jgi:hypothetical protein
MEKPETTATAANAETVKSPEMIKWLRDHQNGAISC